MVTATRDRQHDSQTGFDALDQWGQRSAFGTVKGWPWWAAVLLALGLSVVGAVIDMRVSGSIGKVFEGAYFLGCVGAVCMVRRRNLFSPMVQAPLILAITIPVVVLLTKGMPSGSSTMSKLITLGVPLVTGFPTMAITTIATVVIGGIRFLVQRKPVSDGAAGDDDLNDRGEARRRSSDRDGEQGERSAGTAGGRPRQGERSGRPAQGRKRDDRDGSADDRSVARDRGRSQPQARSRSEAPERSGRSGSGRAGSSGQDRERSQGRERDRGQAPRSAQSRDRDRGQAPKSGRPSMDDERRQPPPRRRDDDY